jgi:Uma2 family endonuclease
MDSQWAEHPTLVVEILSPSTEAIDRREKFLNYRQIETVQEYVLIAQKSLEVTVFRRSASWSPVIVRSREGVAELQSIGLSLPLTEIYRDTALI